MAFRYPDDFEEPEYVYDEEEEEDQEEDPEDENGFCNEDYERFEPYEDLEDHDYTGGE